MNWVLAGTDTAVAVGSIRSSENQKGYLYAFVIVYAPNQCVFVDYLPIKSWGDSSNQGCRSYCTDYSTHNILTVDCAGICHISWALCTAHN